MYKAYFDASVDVEKKRAAIAYIVFDNKGDVVTEEAKDICFLKNVNYAEWLALNALLKSLRKLRINVVDIYGDSLYVIQIANGLVKGKKQEELHRIIWKYGSKFKSITFNWVDRKQNKQADKLTKKVIVQTVEANKQNSRLISKNNTFYISPEEFDFNFRYRELKRKIIAIG